MGAILKRKRSGVQQILDSFVSMFTFRKRGKFYTTFTRRMQLIQQVRTLKEQSVNDIRQRLNVEYK